MWNTSGVLGVCAGMCVLVSGCASVEHARFAKDEAAVVQGPAARDNDTPMKSAYACMAGRLKKSRKIGIGVGNVKDYTGKYSDVEGNAITQGGALMVMSALGKLGPSIRIHERFDTRIAELELVYTENRQLGDGNKHNVDGKKVAWKPYYGGSIRNSDYFIVGGITELNYNIQSGGGEASVSLIGPKARVYTMNVAADLRIVGSQSLVVKDTVSLQKQITGYEVGFGVFRFFGNTLVDVNVGAKNQEPLQLGVRTVLELGVLELMSSVTRVPFRTCLDKPGSLAGDSKIPVAETKPAKSSAPSKKKSAAPRRRPSTGSTKTTQASRSKNSTDAIHVVAPGETVFVIASKYGADPALILASNGISSSDTLSRGRKLRIPVSGGSKLNRSSSSPVVAKRSVKPAPAPVWDSSANPLELKPAGRLEPLDPP